MISPSNLNTTDAKNLMTFFDARLKKLLKDPKNFEYFTDEQMEILENSILPSVQAILEEAPQEVPGGHA